MLFWNRVCSSRWSLPSGSSGKCLSARAQAPVEFAECSGKRELRPVKSWCLDIKRMNIYVLTATCSSNWSSSSPTKGFLCEKKNNFFKRKEKYWFNQRFSVTLQSTIFSYSSNSLDWSYLRSYQNILHKSKRQVTLFYLTWCLFLVFQGLTHFWSTFVFLSQKYASKSNLSKIALNSLSNGLWAVLTPFWEFNLNWTFWV